MKSGFYIAGAASLAAFLSAGPALAQTPPTGNIDERVRQQVSPPGEREQEDALMTGDSDLILLRRTKLFNLHGSLDVNGTSNAYLAPTNAVADGFAQLQAGIGMGTRVGGKVDLFADLSLSGVRYFEQGGLDYNALTGAIGAGVHLGKLRLSATYQPQLVFSRDFGTRQLTSHRFRLSASAPFTLKGVTIQPEAHGERVITRPRDYSAWSVGASLTASVPLSKKAPLFAYVSAGYDRREFDDYFTAFVGLDRKDSVLSASAGIVWRPRTWGEVRVNYSFGRDWSTSDVNGYTAHTGTLGVAAVLRFCPLCAG
ncbi:MAG: hypothetical protein QM676_10920 [Novosphingobium sp.]